MVELRPTHSDDPDFVQLGTQIINNLIRLHSPQEVYAIEIDHWFDHKWQSFSGKTLGALPLWRSTLTVPPFDPGRVVKQHYFRATEAGSYIAADTKPLHPDQWSGHNLHRFIKFVSSSGLFVWYSGETKTTNRASLMTYLVRGEEAVPWYASFVKRDRWELNKVKGISRVQFADMVQ